MHPGCCWLPKAAILIPLLPAAPCETDRSSAPVCNPVSDVADCMLIFDEAHNIEDVCREAASVEVELQTIVEVRGREWRGPSQRVRASVVAYRSCCMD